VFRLTPSEYLTRNEIDAAIQVRFDEFNTQQQPRIVWQPTSMVARAYLDQLTRNKAIQPQRAASVKEALDRSDGVKSAQDKGGTAALDQLDALASQLDADAAAARGRDQVRLKALAETLRGRAARVR